MALLTNHKNTSVPTSGESPTLTIERWQKCLHSRYIQEVAERRDKKLFTSKEHLINDLSIVLRQMLKAVGEELSEIQIAKVTSGVVGNIIGLGALEVLSHDPLVTDVLINRYDNIWVERNGQLERSAITFDSEDALRTWLERILLHSGKMLSRAEPIVDAVLPCGARINVVGAPVCSDGIIISLRFFRANAFSLRELIRREFFNMDICRFLKFAVRSRMNIMVAGASGSGKTTLLNLMAAFIPSNERIVTIEDTPELSLRHPHVIRLISGDESQQKLDASRLFKASLRMRADRILVGELRGKEVVDALQAMSTGHRGSLSTLHANSAVDIFDRVKLLAQLYADRLADAAIAELFTRSVDLLIYMARDCSGKRYVAEVIWRGHYDDRSQVTLFQANDRYANSTQDLVSFVSQELDCQTESDHV